MRKMLTVVGLITALLVAALAVAQPLISPKNPGSASFNISAITVGGAARSSSASYVLESITGEPITGYASSASYKLCLGWYCTVPRGLYNLMVEGLLRYDNGTAVANTDVQLAVWNSTAFTYTAKGKTNAEGWFNVTIAELPEPLIDAGYFRIELTAFGDIEALYSCQYSLETGICGI